MAQKPMAKRVIWLVGGIFLAGSIGAGLIGGLAGLQTVQGQRIAGLPAGVLAFADLIVYNGKVVSMDDRSLGEERLGTVVQAMAVRDGTIIALGTDAEVMPYGGENTHYLNLQGRTVVPGLIDPHLHLHDGAPRRWGLPVLPRRSSGQRIRR